MMVIKLAKKKNVAIKSCFQTSKWVESQHMSLELTNFTHLFGLKFYHYLGSPEKTAKMLLSQINGISSLEHDF